MQPLKNRCKPPFQHIIAPLHMCYYLCYHCNERNYWPFNWECDCDDYHPLIWQCPDCYNSGLKDENQQEQEIKLRVLNSVVR